MADTSVPASMNGVPMDEDEFERNLKEILDDGPNLNDLSSTVQSGTPQKMGSQSAYDLSETSLGGATPTSQPTMSRSLTLPSGTRMFC